MDRKEQNEFLSKWYTEAVRYMNNAKETLRRAGKDGSYYTDPKYVQTACGTAYSGVLIALDAWFVLKEIPKLSRRQRKSIDYYMANVAAIDKKIAAALRMAYNILHLDGYYDGITGVKAIENGFDAAYEIIEKIKPEHFELVEETRAQRVKRGLDKLLVSMAVMFR
jgi:hypothetical protein